MIVDKNALHAELRDVVEAELAGAERAHRTTMEGATHEEAKPENDKDTRALEQTYLARGQAMRVDGMRTTLAEVKSMRVDIVSSRIILGSLVTIEEDDATQVLFITPGGGGSRLAGGQVQVVTLKSPLGAALVGKTEGEECEVKVAGRVRELTIVRVE